MKWKEIVTNAETVKKQMEKNKKLASIKGYTYAELLYVFCKAVKNPGKSQAYKKVEKAKKPTGTNVNKTLTKKEYLALAEKTIGYIDKNGICPNSIKYTSEIKLRPRLLLYCLAKVIVYYNSHKNVLPKSCLFNNSDVIKGKSTEKVSTPSTTSFKKYGHSTEHCCDDMGQNTPYYCGCHSLQEVFRNLTGKVIPQSTIASVCGTTSDGTDHEGLNTCVAWFSKKYGFDLSVEWKNFSDIGWSGLKKIINSDNQDCVIHNLYRDTYGHYEVINRIYSDYSDVQNSLGDKCSSGCYYGYVEERYHSTFESYMSGISQKSVMIITRKK